MSFHVKFRKRVSASKLCDQYVGCAVSCIVGGGIWLPMSTIGIIRLACYDEIFNDGPGEV